MIGPSSGTGSVPEHEVSDNQSKPGKKRIFEDLDIESLCEEVQNSHKRYQYQDIETPMEVVVSNQAIDNTAAVFSPLSAQEAVEDCPVARLEVLLVDGTKCTWTTVSELESQQNIAEIAASPATSSSSLDHRQEQVIQEVQIEETSYQVGSDYWEPIVTVPSTHIQQNKPDMPSISQQQQQQFDDQETGNLSWLLDFKLDSFIGAADEKSSVPSLRDNHSGSKTKLNGRFHGSAYVNDVKKNYNENGSWYQESNQNYSSLDNKSFASSRCNGPKKPPFTYTELIEHALREKGELTVSAIYQWISEHFPYYKSNDDRWKNSVRHNLSINPHFRKGSKAPHGAGHLWAIANRSGDSRPRQTINIRNANSFTEQISKCSTEIETHKKSISHMNPIDEVEAATASITQQSSEEETESMVNSVTLEHCAEEILSGIKKEVEVQYLVPMMVSSNVHNTSQANHQTQELHYPVKESDFLNPVSKEVVAEECGLISEGYLVTDLNPTSLGLNMVEPEIITSDNLFGEELSFQFYELSSPSQIQSA
ncbi:Forkhead transcription factor HCM1 [Anthophora plagiata]